MASKFITFLETVGKDFNSGIEKALPYAQVAVPFVAAANPAAGALLQTSIGVVVAVEQKFAALNQQSGSGAQKSAQALQILEPYILSAFGTKDAAVAQNYINAVVAMLNIPVAPKAA